MTDRLKGETLVILKGGRELTLLFDFDAYCAIEDASDLRMNEILAEMAGPPAPGTSKPTFRHPKVRSQVMLLYGATRWEHPQITLEECKELMSHHTAAILWPMLSALTASLGHGDGQDGDGEEAAGEPGSGPMSEGGIGTDSAPDGARQDSTRSASGGKRRKPTRGR